jgi:CPA2 family monovalent cation:H+ antiporter-2
MALTPFLISAAPKLADWITSFNFVSKWLPETNAIAAEDSAEYKDHVIIVGYGLNGQNIARAAKTSNVPYIVLELNPVTVQEQSEQGVPIHYGDATHAAILEHAGIARARVLVVVIYDSLATRKVVSIAHGLNPNVYIIARTRFVSEMETLYECGANEVIPEEFETSVEIFTRVLKKYLVAEDIIRSFTQQIRSNSYQMLRQPNKITSGLKDLEVHLPDIEISVFQLGDKPDFHNKQLQELDWKKKYGIIILAVRRNEKTFIELHGKDAVFKGDELIVIGKTENLANFSSLICD